MYFSAFYGLGGSLADFRASVFRLLHHYFSPKRALTGTNTGLGVCCADYATDTANTTATVAVISVAAAAK